jgi:hypothetical protein
MGARRLLIVMLVLLTISTLAAALVPPTERRRERSERTGARTDRTDTARRQAAPRGGAVEALVDAGGHRPPTITVSPGDTLSLGISSQEAGEVEVPAFGLVKAVAPAAPARFELLLRRPGRFEVRMVEGNRRVATIRVRG